MSETQRKLTTIFAADVQDYTRLMGADEEGTLATLKHYRDAMSRLIGAHGGRVVNTWGDGLLAEFPSVVEAVRTAVDVQTELAGFNARRPADGRMLFRIGVNLGDVIVEGDDLYGDGVNIAARLQASAPAGGIVISSTVHDQVRNKVGVGFDFLGDLTAKNLAEAIPTYAVRIGGSGRPAPGAGAGTTRPAPAATPRTGDLLSGRLRVLAVVAALLVAINAIAWQGGFWARWPLAAMAFLLALRWSQTQTRLDRRTAFLGVIGLGLVGINLLAWHGIFWAVWPLLGIVAFLALRRVLPR